MVLDLGERFDVFARSFNRNATMFYNKNYATMFYLWAEHAADHHEPNVNLRVGKPEKDIIFDFDFFRGDAHFRKQ